MIKGKWLRVQRSGLKKTDSSYETIRNDECRLTNDGIALRGVGAKSPTSRRLREIFFKIDRIHSFDVRCWTFDVRRSSVSFSIRLDARGQAALTPDTRNLNPAGNRNHPYHPFRVDQSLALWTRIFTSSCRSSAVLILRVPDPSCKS